MIQTRSKTGAMADTMGIYGKPNAMIYLGESKICRGKGLFARRFIPKGTLVTKYSADKMPLCQAPPPPDNGYMLELEEDENDPNSTVYVGISDLNMLHHKGLGQFANDAISKTLTGQENNCWFHSNERGVYLRAFRDIKPGQELLVAYGLSYWNDRFPPDTRQRDWVDLMLFFAEAVQKIHKRMKVYEVLDYTDYGLTLKLEKYRRYCPYIEDWHTDDKVILHLQKDSDDKWCNVFYKCQECSMDSYKMLRYELQ